MSVAPDIAFLFDTDALIQIILAGQHGLLSNLRQDFGVACFIMMEVEVELRSKPRLAGLIKPALDKALRNGWIKVLSSSDLEQLACLQGNGPVSLADIRELGAEYALDVQDGEAYTHAAAILLDIPSVSNDINAIKVLENNGKLLPPTILRSWDIFGFFFLEKYLDPRAAEQIRTNLMTQLEWVPACMKNSSFADGFPSMACRLHTSMATSGGSGGWSQPFYLRRIDRT
jgi:hypothetical protein